MKLRPVFQIPWSGRPPPRAGRAAARFGAQLTARTARHPVCGEPFLPPNFRRRVAGVPPVRREALRVSFLQFKFHVRNEVFSNFDRPPLEEEGGKAEKFIEL